MTDRATAPGPAALASYLLESGAADARWAEAVAAVSRADFLPDVIWPYDMTTRQSVGVDRRTDPDRWLQVAFEDMPLTIQWDDGNHEGLEPGQLATSSASMPSVVTQMLVDAELEPGMRVLEIGTGTGWSSALMAHVLGPDAVVTIEIDEAVGKEAARRLEAAGAGVQTVIGDGRAGWPAAAPYDRVIATVGVRSIAAAWIAQTRPGGLIVAPWGTRYGNGDALVRLTVGDNGTAAGRFVRPLEFMKVRSERTVWPNLAERLPAGFPNGLEPSGTDVTLDGLRGDTWGPTEFVIGLAVPDCAHAVLANGNVSSAWFYGLANDSWATVTFDGQQAVSVYQGGPRQLWNEVESALRWWESAGRPGLERFGLTADGRGETPWLDELANCVPQTAPSTPVA